MRLRGIYTRDPDFCARGADYSVFTRSKRQNVRENSSRTA